MSRLKLLAPLLVGFCLISLLLAALSTQAAMPLGATISVTNSSGGTGGPDCTLRDAITTANTATNTGGCILVGAGSPVTITLDAVGPYIFSVVDNTTDAANALPAVTGTLVIQGNGRTLLRSAAGGTPSFRLLYVSAGADLTVEELVIGNGQLLAGDGGGIRNDGTLKVVGSTLDDNVAGDGGGIANFGTLRVINSTLSDNEGWNCFRNSNIAHGGAGPDTPAAGNRSQDGPYGNSGGISNYGVLTFVGSTLSGNYSICFGGGIYNTGTVTVTESIFSGNVADVGEGGAIYNDGGTLTIASSTLSGNVSYCCDGGAIFNLGSLLVTDSTFNSNASEFIGGGISNYGTLIVSNSTLSDNRAVYRGGGISNNGVLAVVASTLSGNWVPDGEPAFNAGGGGIHNSGTLTVSNSTLSGNWVGALGEGFGGGIHNRGTLAISNSTFSDNSAVDGGGGIYNYSTGTLHFSNTIAANSPNGGDCHNIGAISANIANLIEDGSCSPAFSGDPLLGPLQDNGGPTWTHALLEFSPALDMGNAAVCALPPVNGADQRGVTRPQGLACDIGAFEREVEIEPITGLAAANSSPSLLGATTTLTATVASGTEVSYTWDFDDGTVGAGAVVTHTYAAGIYTAVVTATNPVSAMTTTTTVTIYQLPTPEWRLYLPVVNRP